MSPISLEILIFALVVTFLLIFLFIKDRQLTVSRKLAITTEGKLRKQVYEAELLRELSDKFNYSLNIKNVLDTIINSLEGFIQFSSACYLLINGDDLHFYKYSRDPIAEYYVNQVKDALLLGIKEVLGEGFNKAITKEVSINNEIRRVVKSELVNYFNIPITVSGELVAMLNIGTIKMQPYSDDDITLLYHVVKKASNSVTKLKEIIAREESKLKVMVESMNDGVVMLDATYNVLVCNPTIIKYLKLPYDASNTNLQNIVSSFGDSLDIKQELANVLKLERIQYYSELKIHDCYFQITLFPIKSGLSTLGVGILMHDSSKEMGLKKLREDFTAMMVHELRSPLSVIKGTADLLLNETPNIPTDQISKLLVTIKDSSTGMLNIVNDLLDVAKIESDKIGLVKQYGNVNNILKYAYEYYLMSVEAKSIKFILNLDQSLGDIPFDTLKLQQVINNLISNALKFTEAGGSITLATQGMKDFVQVSVIDTGCGVEDGIKTTIFSKFVQGTRPGNGIRGTGLGLAIAKGIVEAHGGTIWVDNNLPKGAKFNFTLPKV